VTRTCFRCGTIGEGPDDGMPAGWSFAVEDKRMTYTCPDCVRRNVRSIEAKLPEEWWE
jgi:hypothetical protein